MLNIEDRYRHFEHTADLGLEACGETLVELFQNAAWGLTDTITDANEVRSQLRQDVQIEASSQEELLIRWLSELLYLFETKQLLFSVYVIKRIAPNSLQAQVRGEPFDVDRHQIRREVKAVTYHQAAIEKEKIGYKGTVILDI